jgi:hypothetical protein
MKQGGLTCQKTIQTDGQFARPNGTRRQVHTGIERTMSPDLVASLQYTEPYVVPNHNTDANQRYIHTKP